MSLKQRLSQQGWTGSFWIYKVNEPNSSRPRASGSEPLKVKLELGLPTKPILLAKSCQAVAGIALPHEKTVKQRGKLALTQFWCS